MEEVRNWLRGFGLEDYAEKFQEDGWDKLAVLFHITDEDLENCILKPGHRKRFHLALTNRINITSIQSDRDDSTTQANDVPGESRNFCSNLKHVAGWLKRFGLGEYTPCFEENGWDIVEVLAYMEGNDIKDCISKPGHRKKFQLAINSHNCTDEFTLNQNINTSVRNMEAQLDICIGETNTSEHDEVNAWLTTHGLEHYIKAFTTDGWDTLEVLSKIETDYLKQCISKPGHRKCFQLAMQEYQFEKGLQKLPECTSTQNVDTDIYQGDNESETMLIQQGRTECVGGSKVMTKSDTMTTDSINQQTVQINQTCLESEQDILGRQNSPLQRLDPQKPMLTILSTTETFSMTKMKVGDTKDCSMQGTVDESETVTELPTELTSIQTQRTNGNQKVQKQHVRFQLSLDDSQSSVELVEQLQFCEAEFSGDLHATDDTLSLSGTEDSESVEGIERDLHMIDSEQHSFNKKDTIEGKHSTEGNITQAECDQITQIPETIVENDESSRCRAHTFSGFMTRSASLPPFVPSTIIHKPQNVSLGGSFGNTKPGQGNKRKARDNFKNQMKTILNISKEKDSLFVETTAFKELEEIVESFHWAVIIGVPGDGKTAMAAHLSLKYCSKGYEHLELHFARDWKDWVDGGSGKYRGKKQFILIDDIFGRMSVDERKVSEWTSIFNLMQGVVRQSKGDLLVVCTSRKYVFMDVKTRLVHFTSFQSTSVVDLTHKRFALTLEEKSEMWKRYTQQYKVNTSKPKCISNETKVLPHGFPHCVELFATNIYLQNKGVSFFDDPMQYVCSEITNFRENDRIKYYILLLVLFYNNALSESILEEITNNPRNVKRIIDAAGLPKHPTKVDLTKALRGLKDTYIAKGDGNYSFSHDSIRENLAYLFIQDNPYLAIDEIHFSYLTDHTRCHGQEADNKNRICTLNQDCNKRLAKRVIKEIMNGKIVAVCAHKAWDSAAYVADFMEFVLNSGTDDVMQLQQEKQIIADIFTTKDSSKTYIFDFSLFDALRFFGHRKAVSQLLEYKELDILHDIIEIPPSLSCDRLLSNYLSKAMDAIGASDELRRFQIFAAVAMEILDTLCIHIAGQDIGCYIFGSHSEGTRIKTHITKLESYVNYVFCHEGYEVIQNISDIQPSKLKDRSYLLAITDEITKPGYVKLQVIQSGLPLTRKNVDVIPELTTLDYKNRIVVFRERRPEKHQVDELSGSAKTTDIVMGKTFEICYSYRCKSWPLLARKWLTRVRHHNWPSRYAVEKMKTMGFFLLPVGGGGSIEKNLEWKMSFLLQERLLMSLLNETQYKCYILLKMINNDVISSFVKDVALVSYHLKTCMFYVVENTPSDIWKPDNLLDCVQVCLKCILQWVRDGVCPNYFIPEENMFHGRVHGELQSKLRNALTKLIASEFKYIPHIQCGNLGPRLIDVIHSTPTSLPSEFDFVPNKLTLYTKAVQFISLVKSRILSKLNNVEVRDSVSFHFQCVTTLRRMDIRVLKHHSKKQKEFALSVVLPFIELSLMSNIVALEYDKGNTRAIVNVIQSNRWSELVSEGSDPFSAKLKQATIMYMLNFPDASLRILEALKAMLMGSLTVSICGCKFCQTENDDNVNHLVQNMTEEEFRTKHCIPCIAFLPTERQIVPDALKNEMERTESNVETCLFWSDWAVIDGKILLLFMLYLNHKKRYMVKETEVDIKMIEDVIETDNNLGHQVTGLNILGWIYLQENNKQKASEMLDKSIGIQSRNNAAHIHKRTLTDSYRK